MEEKKLVPKLRFPGFTEPWEQRKLGDFTNQISTSVNPEDAKLPLWSLTAEAGLIEKTDRYERDFLVKKKDQFKRIETNTLVYNPMNITIGSIDIYTGRFPIAVSGYYVSIVYDKTLDTDFLKEILLLPSSLKMYKNYATGSLIERQRVQYHTFSKLQFLFPTLEEQRTIGRLFKSLNLIITLHQRKLEHLKLKKKSLLQKLFPKEGEVYPELRFPGFTDPWEQRKFKNFVQIRRGLTYKPSDIASSGIRVLRSSNINEDQFITGTNDVFVNIDAVDIPYVKSGDILLTSANGSAHLVGKHAIINDIVENSAVHGGFMLLVESKNPQFINALLGSNWYKKFINLYVSGGNGAIGNLSKSDLEEQDVMFPSEEEQKAIGRVYFYMNHLITLHQRKLEHLQLLKKALLQQLFV